MKGIDPLVLIALGGMLAQGVYQFRLTRANRRKVIAEGSRNEAEGADLMTQGAGRLVLHWEADNNRLRSEMTQMHDELESCHRRIDQLEDLLRQHGVAVPAVD